MNNINNWMYRVMDAKEFTGTPARYKKCALLITLHIMAWIYVGFIAVKYLALGENWLQVWELPVGIMAAGLFLKGYIFKSMMRLDAQYGSGSGWKLTEKTVKLPELKS